jgi:HEAT repeat protein
VESLKHPDPWTRETAAATLGRKGKADFGVAPGLQAALADDDERVRRAAAKALQAIERS